jgi:hypothetical protein
MIVWGLKINLTNLIDFSSVVLFYAGGIFFTEAPSKEFKTPIQMSFLMEQHSLFSSLVSLP